jgi:hypothetical protein
MNHKINTLNQLFGTDQPTAHITVSRNRVKTYGSNVYLKDKTNFEIELWNPKPIRVLAKIKVNGVYVSGGGIVVNPGQRVYLERFVDVNRKFQFSTYEVEDSKESKKAIQYNGDVQVDFYPEIVPPDIIFNGTTITVAPLQYGPNQILYGNGTISGGYVAPTFTNDKPTFTSSSHNLMFCSSSLGDSSNLNLASMDGLSGTLNMSKGIETGRVEQGAKSEQSLSDTYGNFANYKCSSFSMKILPESSKPTEIGEIRSYCTGCGRKVKDSKWKFCPTCGTAME